MDANLFLQQFGHLAQGEGGIKKLRDLIVHQAISGKFTSSSKADWTTKTLGQVVTFEYGKGMPAKSRSSSGTHPVYGSNGIVGHHDEALIHYPSIVIGRKGSAGALNIANVPFWPTDVTYYSTPPRNLDIRFYFYLLSTLGLDKLGKGIKPGLNRNEAYKIKVSYPPLAEQKRIVAKVDELMALCDKLEAEQKAQRTLKTQAVQSTLHHLTNAESPASFGTSLNILERTFGNWFDDLATVKHLRATILQLAVRGKLVPQNPTDEPASELLKRIEAEKKRLKIKIKIPAIAESTALHSLPNTWAWEPLGRLISMMDSGWSPACEQHPVPEENSWGVLKTTAVQVMRYLDFENKTLPAKLQPRPEIEVKAGDLLITRAGPRNRVGISCLVEKTRARLMISDKIIRFHLVGDLIYERYVSLCLNAGETSRYIESAKSGMADSQLNISQDKLKAAPIPLPPLAEQKRIVDKVDELMMLCDQLEAHITQIQTLNTYLMDSLIHRMTAGEDKSGTHKDAA